MKGQLTIQYLASFIFFLGLVIYIYFSYSANLPAFVEEVRKEDVRSKAFQLSEILINDPGNWTAPVEVKVDVMLIIDVSGSMDGEAASWGENCKLDCSTFGTGLCSLNYCSQKNCTDKRCADCDGDGHWADFGESPCAINDAKNASKTFVDQLNFTENQDWSGIVIFNQTDYLKQALVSDKGIVKNSIDQVYANQGANTAIGGGIRNATEHLKNYGRLDANLVQVLLTDGRDYPTPSNAEGAAQEAVENNIKIYTIGLGESGHFNETLLNLIASITDGKYYHAPSSSDLEEIYKQIAIEMKLQPKRIGLSDEKLNKTNLITMDKVRYLEDLCTSFENVQQKLAIDEPFSIHIFNISQDLGKRNSIMECVPPDFPKTIINATIKRIVALENTETGQLELAEIIVQM